MTIRRKKTYVNEKNRILPGSLQRRPAKPCTVELMFPGRAWVAILGFSLICSIPATAQRYASLTGHILDPSEAGISGAAVMVVNEDTGFRRSAVSELGGTYLISSLDAGMYKVTVRKENFQTLVRFNLELKPATSTLADFRDRKSVV